MAVTPERLKAVPLFSQLSGKDLQHLANTMRERTYSAGQNVTEEGAGAVGFFVIDSGEAQVTVDGVPKGTLGPGDHFGEIALITGSTRSATIVATSELHCFGLAAWDFRPLVEGDATIAWGLLQGLAGIIAGPNA